MKKLGLSIGLLGLLLGFAACGNKAEEKKEGTDSKTKEEKVIKVASQTTPMTDVVEVAAKEAKKDGWKVELVQVTDNIQYNELLKNKEVDANFAQHEPYMQKFNQEKKANLVAIQKIYNAKVGFYSKDYKDIKDIPEGAKVAIPNDVSNEGRALAMLNDQGLITLKEGVGFEGTLKDIEKNDKNLEFMSVDLLNLAEAYNEKEVALVYNYPTYIAKIGLKPADALFLEKTVDERFAISLVAREDNQDSEEIKALKKAMTSQAVKEFLEKEHSDTLVPAF
ncbi:MetQ/NlpA family ABC transporter substrate-binding protein [Vagococcus carniphilus]|uniref:MetQ/NlpA family ABC transporter substrate-binding protein n=1 Tax=Vagococcus carniphilus TaxID=218144 RepID=UPI003B5A13F2